MTALLAGDPPVRVPRAQEAPWSLTLLRAPAIEFVVYGTPAPQGSKNARAIYRGKGESRQFTGKVAMHESSKKVGPWRDAVKAVALAETQARRRWEPLDGPLVVDMVFTMPKGTTLAKWLDWHERYPDVSKLARSTEDALTNVVWADDSRITAYRRLEKRFAGSEDSDALYRPGAVIRVWQVPAYLINTRKDLSRRRQL